MTDAGNTPLAAGVCAGFRAGTGDAHCLVNETPDVVVYLEVGDRSPGDRVAYPGEGLQAEFGAGKWHYFHKDGTPW